MTKLLMVCMGNLCRSPMAQSVALHLATQAGLAPTVVVDSAGTHAGRGHVTPDPRAKMALLKRGYPAPQRRTRPVSARDFGRYDLILAMDQSNLDELLRICPSDQAHKLRLFLACAPDADTTDVPDPYYGSAEGFERVLDLCEAGARGLITKIQAGLLGPYAA